MNTLTIYYDSDVSDNIIYSNATVQAWEIAIRFAFFFVVAVAGIGIRERQRASTARISLLEHTQKLEKQIIEVSEYEPECLFTLHGLSGPVRFTVRHRLSENGSGTRLDVEGEADPGGIGRFMRPLSGVSVCFRRRCGASSPGCLCSAAAGRLRRQRKYAKSRWR